jgi:hypothetical protein
MEGNLGVGMQMGGSGYRELFELLRPGGILVMGGLTKSFQNSGSSWSCRARGSSWFQGGQRSSDELQGD